MEQISIHDKPIDENPSPVGIQDNEAKRDVRLVKDLFEQAKKARAEFDVDWSKRRDFYKGKQWDKQSASYAAKPVVNVCRMIIQGLVPILTDARPGFSILPPEPSDFKFARQLSSLTGSWWEKPCVAMDQTLIEAIMDSMILDLGVLKVTWDPEAEYGAGEIKCEAIDPMDVYWSKGASDFEKNCSYVIHKVQKTVGEVKIMAPEFAHLIKSDESKDDKKSEGIQTDVTLVSPTDKNEYGSTGFPVNTDDDRKLVTILECWTDDDTLEEYYEESKDQSGQVVAEKRYKKKYPHGVLITILPNANLRLWKVPNPYKRMKNPFVRIVDSIMPRQICGEGEIEPLMEVQRMINKVRAIITDYMNLMGNPIWLVERTAGVDVNRLTNQCGLIIETDDGAVAGGKIRRDIPPPLPEYIFRFDEVLQRLAETISGLHDVTQGRKPAGVTAAAAIDELQEAGHTRVRLKERNLQTSLSQLGSKVISLMLQFYKEPRVARITNDTEWPEYFEFYFEDTDQGTIMNRRGYKADMEQGEYIPEQKMQTVGPSRGMFDVKVQSGTAMPFAKAQRSNLALRLREMRDLSREGLLSALEWPDKEEEINRLTQEEQAAMAAAPPQGA